MCMLECPALGRSLLPEEVSAEVLRGLWSRLPGTEPPAKAVITVPPHFEERHRGQLRGAGSCKSRQRAQGPGVPTHVTLYEPVAAALAYGLSLEEYSTILVCDLGDGQLGVIGLPDIPDVNCQLGLPDIPDVDCQLGLPDIPDADRQLGLPDIPGVDCQLG
eukprot:gene9292-11008_t